MSKQRERHAIEDMECPKCRAWKGRPCFWQGRPSWTIPNTAGRMFIHPERLRSFQAMLHDRTAGLRTATERGPA